MRKQSSVVISKLQKVSNTYLDSADVVIIGNGIAGLTAATEARRLAPEKRIVMITEQIHPTINTPALKQFAVGKVTQEQLLAYPTGTERQERIHVLTAHVEEIHANSKYVTLNGGCGFGYDKLLIATGSTPTGLPANLPGRNFDGVLTLHHLQNYLDLRRRLPEVREAVVIGGGVHAVETVQGLLYWGIRVHWLIRSEAFMPRMLDQTASEMVLEGIRRSGAIVYMQTEAAGIVGRMSAVAGIITNHQQFIPCQLVLTCTGTQPVMTLAQRCSVPMQLKKGIMVDDQLHTSVRDIYAAGDVAAPKNPQTGSYEPRAQWYAAVSQGRIAGAMMADREDLAQQPFGVPWHATHVGELSMLTVGSPLTQSDSLITLTNTSQGGYRRIAIVDDRLIGYLALGSAQPDSLAIKRVIDEGHSVRNITKALLKGKFDGRQHFSAMHSRAAQGILTSGQLLGDPTPRVPLLVITEPLSSIPQIRQPEPALPSNRPDAAVRQIEPLQVTEPIVAVRNGAQPVPSAEEISPFSGNLPDISTLMNEEVSLFTENEPATSQIPPQKVVESTLAFSFSSEQKPKQGLWTHTAEMPEEMADTQERNAFVTRRVGMPSQTRHPTSSLWSYLSNEHSAITEKTY